MVSIGKSGSVTMDEHRRNFLRYLGLASVMVDAGDSMGYEALKLMMSKHFAIFLNSEEVLMEFFILAKPGADNKPRQELL